MKLKHFLTPVLAVGFAFSAQAKELNYLNLPTYFMAPESSYSELEMPDFENSVSFRETTDRPWYNYGLRMLVMNQSKPAVEEAKANLDAALKAGKNEAKIKKLKAALTAQLKLVRGPITQSLHKKGLLETGDIVLSFRKAWARTIPYAHIQMGVSHAGIIFEQDGKAYNLDMPLDGTYNSSNVNSELTAKHYTDANELHIIRPKNLTPERKKNLNAWVKVLKSNIGKFRHKDQLMKFNGDYTAPKHAKYGVNFITTMGKILMGEYKKSEVATLRKLTMYCSEFTYALLALSNCDPTSRKNQKDIKSKKVLTESASCVKEYFKPVPAIEAYEDEIEVAKTEVLSNGRKKLTLQKPKLYRFTGLLAGPGMIMQHLDTHKSDSLIGLMGGVEPGTINSMSLPLLMDEYKKEIFAQGEKEGLSRGHTALAEDKMIQQLVGGAQMFYDQIANSIGDKDGNFAPGDIRFMIGTRQKLKELLDNDPRAKAALQAIQPNYSPTAYLINAYLPKDHPKRQFDYVTTVSFAYAKDFERAKEVAESKKDSSYSHPMK